MSPFVGLLKQLCGVHVEVNHLLELALPERPSRLEQKGQHLAHLANHPDSTEEPVGTVGPLTVPSCMLLIAGLSLGGGCSDPICINDIA